MPQRYITQRTLNSQCLLQIQIWYISSAISVLKPSTPMWITLELLSTVWFVSKKRYTLLGYWAYGDIVYLL